MGEYSKNDLLIVETLRQSYEYGYSDYYQHALILFDETLRSHCSEIANEAVYSRARLALIKEIKRMEDFWIADEYYGTCCNPKSIAGFLTMKWDGFWRREETCLLNMLRFTFLGLHEL